MQAGGPCTLEARHFAVELPDGWMRAPTDELLATRDGLPLQWIYSQTSRYGDPLKASKKAITKGMLPVEAAEVVRDELKAGGAPIGLEVVENSPATLDAKPGFKLVFRYKTTEGLRMKGVVYGALGEDALYSIGYTAPERHYFDLDLQSFESVRASFRVLPAVSGR
jgi:hypothetical protein